MATHRSESFSISHCAILDGTTGAEHVDGDVFGVRSAALAADIGSFANNGDDREISNWYWFNSATITVTAGFIPFDMVSLITRTPIYDYVDLAAYTAGTPAVTTQEKTTARASAGHIFEQELWTEKSMNSQPFPVLIRMPSKDSAGRIRLVDFVLYKVQFSPINFTGPSYKAGLEFNMSGKANMSTVNEAGESLGIDSNGLELASVGRMISRAG